MNLHVESSGAPGRHLGPLKPAQALTLPRQTQASRAPFQASRASRTSISSIQGLQDLHFKLPVRPGSFISTLPGSSQGSIWSVPGQSRPGQASPLKVYLEEDSYDVNLHFELPGASRAQASPGQPRPALQKINSAEDSYDVNLHFEPPGAWGAPFGTSQASPGQPHASPGQPRPAHARPGHKRPAQASPGQPFKKFILKRTAIM